MKLMYSLAGMSRLIRWLAGLISIISSRLACRLVQLELYWQHHPDRHCFLAAARRFEEPLLDRIHCGEIKVAKTGGLFDSVTTTIKVLVALSAGEPSSVTTVRKVLVLGPWASLGVQVMTPAAEIATLLLVTPSELVETRV